MKLRFPPYSRSPVKAQTPLLQQYFKAKESHPGVLVAMRVGDFYEFYGEDAETAAAALEITLTGREDGKNGRVPMAGVPYHSVEKYLARLVKQGFKVALCDQVEDPKLAKGLVRREVTRVLSAGTVMDDSMLDAGANNFLAAICMIEGKAGLAMLDPSTGEFSVTEIEGEQAAERMLQELARLKPSELLYAEDGEEVGALAASGLGIATSPCKSLSLDRAERVLKRQFDVTNLQGFGLEDKTGAMTAASMILEYAKGHGLELNHVDTISTYSVDGFMKLDPATRSSLELTRNISDGSRQYTLIDVLDETVTSMGARLLKRWIEQPLLDVETISRRHEAVGRLIEHAMTRGDLRDALKKVADIERLVSRAATGLASPRDLSALRTSLLAMPELDDALRKVALGRLQDLRAQTADHQDLAHHLDKALIADPPHALREGGVIKPNFDPELDKLRGLSRDGKRYIAELEKKEREATGIAKLKVGYNSVFGYYLEVSKLHQEKVPDHYIRKQTLVNAERFITAELKEHESAVLGAEEKAVALESDLFYRIRNRVADNASALLQTARAIAELDVLISLTESAVRRRFVRPEIVEDDVLEIDAGRHPVVEAHTPNFVPNDLTLGDTRVVILTGPNMSGKSTYLRQTALTVLMAQIGSFVPADSCRVGLCDRIFTRIGAKDELALGQSTFMVEMVESANILNNSTERSLVILDEVGRGTSTYDGLAIAWAMVEHLARVKAKTLFATHYHQLNALAEQIQGISNFRVAVEEVGDKVVFAHRVLPGGTDRSYGVQVAKMAGLPRSVVARAAEILAELEQRESTPSIGPGLTSVQMTLFEAPESEVEKELKQIDVDSLTPIEALQKLDELKKRL
ncbi:MAG: DNA mismatch repair protein MutS [Armatimonadetes bacterium]|nr:DNA mismatch repair protein MutS [Armatimonadota bacterium]